MAVTIKVAGEGDTPAPERVKVGEVVISLDQFEAFGRFRMDARQIGAFYGISHALVRNIMRRADMRRAYDKGRSETIIALRQKQLQLALAGDSRHLAEAMRYFGEVDSDAPLPADEDAADSSKFDWDSTIEARVREAREKAQNATKH